MNKQLLLERIKAHLQQDLEVAIRAAQTAYEAATHEENIAENKYDTLGLEASYLAAGQARRVEEIRQALALYQQLPVRPFDESLGIRLGDLVTLESEAEQQPRYLFLGPDAAGIKVDSEQRSVTIITPRSPLGQGLLGKFQDDSVEIVINGQRQTFEVAQVL